MKKYLVVVRAGDKSLHPQWIEKQRNWDIAVSYYGDHPERYKNQYDHLQTFKGSKWEGLDAFVKNSEELISRYDYVWFPDDDLFCNSAIINRFFEICALLDLTLAQPALTEYSYYSWEITRQKPELAARLTDFVEIMAPCFKVNLFENFKNTFSENSSGFGLEWLWRKLAIEKNILKFGIIDSTPIFHTRRAGSAGHGGSAYPPQEEMAALLEKYGIKASTPQTIREIRFKSK